MRISAAFFACLFVAAAASAQLTDPYASWGDSPVKYLMTRDEAKEWKSVRTNDAAKAFVDLFWARRDPTPDTPRNEFHAEFDARVLFADQNFSTPKQRGSLTDRGRVVILLGPPLHISGKGPEVSQNAPAVMTAPTDAEGRLTVLSPRGSLPQQTWTYAHERKPKYIPQPEFILTFQDEGHEDWQLAKTERVNPEALLGLAQKAIIVSPALKTAPYSAEATIGRKTSLSNNDLRLAYTDFKTGTATTSGPALMTMGSFISAEGIPFVAVQLYVPKGSGIEAGQKATFFGVVDDATDGQVVNVQEFDTTLAGSNNDAYADVSLPLGKGKYNAIFGLASGGKIVSARKVTFEVPKLAVEEAAASDLYLSTDIRPLQSAYTTTDPFTFGGLKLVAKADGVFQPQGDLWYFVELRNPGVTAEKNPAIKIEIDIKGKTAKGPAQMRFPLAAAEVAKLKGVENRWAVGQALPLESFLPGDYQMKVKIVDTVLSKTYEYEKSFKIAPSS